MHIPTILKAIDMYLPWKLNNHLKSSRISVLINVSANIHLIHTVPLIFSTSSIISLKLKPVQSCNLARRAQAFSPMNQQCVQILSPSLTLPFYYLIHSLYWYFYLRCVKVKKLNFPLYVSTFRNISWPEHMKNEL